jgi:HEPN domain-containing protein
MSDARTDIEKEVQEWLDFAAEDLRYAQHGLTLTNEEPTRLIAYHAQQCVEKNLKAYLIFRKYKFDYSHSIAYLLDCCARFSLWADSLRDAEELTPYAVTARYPGIATPLNLDDARRAIQLAGRVASTVHEALADEGFGQTKNVSNPDG